MQLLGDGSEGAWREQMDRDQDDHPQRRQPDELAPAVVGEGQDGQTGAMRAVLR